MRRIGLTGGIASGKSMVVDFLAQMGAAVVRADELAHLVMQPGTEVFELIRTQFGDAFLDSTYHIDRKRLGDFVFSHPEALTSLNRLVHPTVLRMFDDEVSRLENEGAWPVVVCEVPLLYELKLAPRFELVVVVYVPASLQKRRLVDRDGLSPLQAEARLNSQLSIEEKRSRADVVIDNSRSRHDTYEQVLRLAGRIGLTTSAG
ncbi:dephospho-CoA kinase [bacterium]|nr:dephospho-CoA kinase [candidate division CSSED10-310 bacterium]